MCWKQERNRQERNRQEQGKIMNNRQTVGKTIKKQGKNCKPQRVNAIDAIRCEMLLGWKTQPRTRQDSKIEFNPSAPLVVDLDPIP